MSTSNSKANQSQGLLLFKLNQRQLFALGTLKIREIVPFTPLTKLPHSHPGIKGTANIRGGTIPIIDMPAVIGSPLLLMKSLLIVMSLSLIANE